MNAASPTMPKVNKSTETPIAWPLRLWIGVEVLFGVAAILSIGLRPGQTATNFAWPIKSEVMAAALGAFYLASAMIFVLPLFARRWQTVRVMVLPAVAFTSTMLLATFLHWDKFSVGTAPFYVWFASYLLPPPIFLGLYWLHQRRSAPVGAGRVQPLAGWVRAGLLLNGGLISAAAVLNFILPSIALERGPWTLTPLTLRALSGWLLVTGLLQISISREGDWSRAKAGAVMLVLLPFTLATQLFRFSGQVDWGNPALWILGFDFSLVAALMIYLWLTGGKRTSAN